MMPARRYAPLDVERESIAGALAARKGDTLVMVLGALAATLALVLVLVLSTGSCHSGGTGLWGVYETSFREAKHVDLTHAFEPSSPLWPGFGPSGVRPARAGSDQSPFAAAGQEFAYLEQGFVATSYELTTDQLAT